jgi:hypothetical protein
MIPFKEITVLYREPEAPATEVIRVVELPLCDVYAICHFGLDDNALAEAAVRRQSSAGKFDQGVRPGWLKTLSDDSFTAVIRAALELNIEAGDRSKKIGGLLIDRDRCLGLQPKESSSSTAPSNS